MKHFLPTLSIIIPVYNAEKVIAHCLESILCQTYSDFEIILVNDGSKDNSLAVCKALATQDSRIVVIDKSNGGPNSARNAGLKASRGGYIMFVDADDSLLDNETIKSNISLFDTDIDIIVFPQYYYTKKGELVVSSALKKKQQFDVRNANDKLELFVGWYSGEILSGGLYSKIYRKEIFDNLFLVEQISFAEDCYHIPDFLERSRIILFSGIGGYVYTYNEESIVNTDFTENKSYDLFIARVRQYSYLEQFVGYENRKSAMFVSLLEFALNFDNKRNQSDADKILCRFRSPKISLEEQKKSIRLLLTLIKILGYQRSISIMRIIRYLKSLI